MVVVLSPATKAAAKRAAATTAAREKLARNILRGGFTTCRRRDRAFRAQYQFASAQNEIRKILLPLQTEPEDRVVWEHKHARAKRVRACVLRSKQAPLAAWWRVDASSRPWAGRSRSQAEIVLKLATFQVRALGPFIFRLKSSGRGEADGGTSSAPRGDTPCDGRTQDA